MINVTNCLCLDVILKDIKLHIMNGKKRRQQVKVIIRTSNHEVFIIYIVVDILTKCHTWSVECLSFYLSRLSS